MSGPNDDANTIPDATVFPPEMVEAPRWLFWTHEQARDKEGQLLDRWLKMPRYVLGGRRGATGGERDLARLKTYAVAREHLAANRERYTGLGFALGEAGQWHGIDLDGCLNENGDFVKDWAAAFVDEAQRAGCYCEVSPSRRGVHVIGYGSIAGLTHGRNEHGIEIYDRGRFFTVTGRRLGPVPKKIGSAAGAIALLPHRRKPQLSIVSNDRQQRPSRPLQEAQGVRMTSTWLAERSRVVEALGHLDANCSRADWIRVGMALHHASGGHPDGLAVWEEWSRRIAPGAVLVTQSDYTPGEDCAAQWGFRAASEHPVTLGSLYLMAKEAGWVPGGPEVKAEYSGNSPADEDDTLALFLRAHEEHQRDPARIVRYEEPRFYIEGLVQEGLPGLLVAPGGTGKTSLLITLAICTATGRAFLDRFKVQQGSFVLLSQDDAQEDLDAALAKMIEAMRLTPGEIEAVARHVRIRSLQEHPEMLTFVTAAEGGAPRAVEGFPGRVVRAVKGLRLIDLRCVVIDTLRQFAGASTNDDAVATIATKASGAIGRGLGCACFMNHHSTKPGSRGEMAVDQYFGAGSAALGDNSRFVWVLQAIRIKDAAERAKWFADNFHALQPGEAMQVAGATQILTLTDTRGSLLRPQLEPILILRHGFRFGSLGVQRKSAEEKQAQNEAGLRLAILKLVAGAAGGISGNEICAGLRAGGAQGRQKAWEQLIRVLAGEGLIAKPLTTKGVPNKQAGYTLTPTGASVLEAGGT